MNKDDVDDPEFLQPSADCIVLISAEAAEQLQKIVDNPPPATGNLKKIMLE